jgi:dolichol kinase
VVGFVVSMAYLLAFHASIPLPRAIGGALLAAFAGAIAELFANERLDDNFLVPIAGVLAASILL